MSTSQIPVPKRRVGPYCAALDRGAIGKINGRSAPGRFLRRIERELIAQIGGEPSFGQRLLIRRVTRAMLQLELLDEKFTTGDWTPHDSRTQGGLSNSVRLALKELGLKSAPAKEPS